MSQPEYLIMYKRVKAELVLARSEHEAWYRAEVRRNHEQAYELLITLAAGADGLSMQIGRLMSIEQRLGELEGQFTYDSTESISGALDNTRRHMHAELLDLLQADDWPDEERLVLKRRLDAHAREELRRRKEMVAFAHATQSAMKSIESLLRAGMSIEIDMRLRELHERLCNKRAELALLHCPTPLSTSTEEPR